MSEQGRPTKYKPEYDNLAFNYALLGATDVEMSKFFEVDETTFCRWKREYPSFYQSIKEAKEQADAKVVRSLYERACGYKAKAVKILSEKGMHTDTVEYEEHYPPDPTAMIFWLKNRQSKQWRDKQEIDQNIQGSIAFNFIEATKEDDKK